MKHLEFLRKPAVWFTAACSAAFVFAVSWVLTRHNGLASSINACTFTLSSLVARGVFAHRWLLREQTAQPARPLAPRELPDWDVQMNGVSVGSLATAELASLLDSVVCDWRLLIAQMFNVIGMAFRFPGQVLSIAPSAAFWVFAVYACFDPVGLIQTLDAIRGAGPQEIQHAASSMLFAFATLVLVAETWRRYASGGRLRDYFGLRNLYREKFDDTVRGRLKISSTGNLQIMRIAGDDVYLYEPDMFGRWWALHGRRARAHDGAA